MTDKDQAGGGLCDEIFPDYPNPAWARPNWMSLDGIWRVEHKGRATDITVPFPVGSEASGVDFPDSGTFVYSRIFDQDGALGDDRLFLNVGAADYESEAFVNGVGVGRHIGGYASFRFEITAAVKPGENMLKIVVRDSRNPGQVRGKQTFLRKPFFVWYSGYAGIWQSVWLERTGPVRIESAKTRADFGARRLFVTAKMDPDRVDARLFSEIETPCGARLLREAGHDGAGSYLCEFSFDELGEFPWTPETPNLYRITYTAVFSGRETDVVESYFGIRRIEARDHGLFLNGEPLFLRMALVQGYYPRGGYSPESSGVIVGDILALKSMGFNGARIHEKIESPRFNYLCDKLGLLTTFEMPSFYWPSRRAFAAYEREFLEIMERDSMHPSAIAWVLFNETWGVWGMYRRESATRLFVEKMVAMARMLDPHRPVIENSGWEHFDSDIVDFHHYLGTADLAVSTYGKMAARAPSVMSDFSIRRVLKFYMGDCIAVTTKTLFLNVEAQKKAEDKGAPWFLSEYGGFGWYKIAEGGSVEDKIERYTADAVESGLFCGYCLTQLYDVGDETNGLLAADRQPKVDAAKMLVINGRRKSAV
ncbi:MAG TPA: glycoside hydrolase family 2 TIM barrel-domain containing protein [Rectinemataceae bacterium]|nr:glycoside hydrolase family 2 TIM barrel-domain containing protein [Rectinemataceae bacterium]